MVFPRMPINGDKKMINLISDSVGDTFSFSS